MTHAKIITKQQAKQMGVHRGCSRSGSGGKRFALIATGRRGNTIADKIVAKNIETGAEVVLQKNGKTINPNRN